MKRRIALLIGNTEYNDDYFQKLVTPGQNVRDFERILKDPERCGFEVTTLIDTSKAEAERYIFELFRNKTQDDFLVFYFAGHGLKDSDGALHLAMEETERDAIEVTALSASFVRTRIDKSFSERIVVILDCCFSGAFGGTMSVYGETIDIMREFEGQGYGRVVLTATDAMQYAWDRNTEEVIGEADNSVFTKYLIEGLSTGEADHNNNGEITVDELFSYGYERTVKTFPKQTPKKFVYDAADDLVFARNPNPNRLNDELISTFTNPNHFVRLAAIHELDELLDLYDEQNPQLVEQIQNSLARLSSDGNEQVSKKACAVLTAFNNRHIIPAGDTKHLSLFISSPDDVHEERQIVRQIVEKLNSDERVGTQVQISIVTCGNPNVYIPMLANQTPKSAMDKEILRPSECDIVLIIIWAGLGTLLSTNLIKEDKTRYEFSTEWEYDDAIKGAKHNDGHPAVLVYRSNQPIIRPGETDLQGKIAQFQKVERFFSQFSGHENSLTGVSNLYDDIEQFETILEKHLRSVIRRLITETPSAQPKRPEKGSKNQPKETKRETINIHELLLPYLNWVIEQHSRLELRGIGGDSRIPTIPLEKVYVALKGSRANYNGPIF